MPFLMKNRMTMSRGLHNNNPGNIRRSKTTYRGETDSDDPDFKQFKSIGWGYRAIFVLLHTYQVKYNLLSIRGMISRYAPPSENNTAAYIRFVSNYTGIDPDVQINTLDGKNMVGIAEAISKMENGTMPQLCEILEGWALFEKYPV